MRSIRLFFGLVVLATLTGAAGFVLARSKQAPAQVAAVVIAVGKNGHPPLVGEKEKIEFFYTQAGVKSSETKQVVSGIVPHHLIAGKHVAEFFSTLREQKPPVVVLIGPNHPQEGPFSLVGSRYGWQTPYGLLEPETDLLTKLEKTGLIRVEEKIIGEEHSIGALTPFIKRTWPNTKLLPIIVKNNITSSTVDELVKTLARELPKNSLVLMSVDFSHLLPVFVADYHDAMTVNVLASGDVQRLKNVEVDSQTSLHALLAYNRLQGAGQFTQTAHSNSATIADKPETVETTSHVLGYFTSGVTEVNPTISIQFFGDVMLERNVEKAFGKEGMTYLLKKIAHGENRFFTGQDMIVANLEGPFASSRVQTSKSIAFRFDPKLAAQLKAYGFDAFSLANNHTLDMGKKNVTFTEDVLKKHSFGYFGRQIGESVSTSMWVMGEAQGLPEKVAFVGFNNTDHPLSMDVIKNIMEKAKAAAPNVIVFMHWGNEYQRKSHQSQQELARWLINNGAMAVIGAHPHVVQETEIYKGRPIFYSLGNFIFDQYFSKDTQEGYSVGLLFGQGTVKEIHYLPFYGVKSQVNLMMGRERKAFLDWMNKNSRLDGGLIIDGKLVL